MAHATAVTGAVESRAMQECELTRIVLSDTMEQQYVYLREKEGARRVFPIVIGRPEARAIDRCVRNQKAECRQHHLPQRDRPDRRALLLREHLRTERGLDRLLEARLQQGNVRDGAPGREEDLLARQDEWHRLQVPEPG